MRTLKEVLEKNLENQVAPEIREQLEQDIKNLADESDNNWLRNQFKPVQIAEQLLLFSNIEGMK